MTTLPPHIANAETPRTDKLNVQWHAYTNLGLHEKPLTFEDFCAQLERENLYLREVLEKIVSRLYSSQYYILSGTTIALNQEALTAYEQLKIDLQ